MKKIVVIVTLILVLYTSGCAKTEPQNTKEPTSQAAVSASESSDVTPSISDASESVSVPSVNPIKAASIYVDEVNEERGTLYLGQSQIDAYHVFYANDIEMTGNDFAMSTEYMSFSLADGQVDGISVGEYSEMPTTLGLKFGDSVEQMIKLYGTEYITEQRDFGYTVYEYQMNDHYFYVEFLDGKVDGWGIHR